MRTRGRQLRALVSVVSVVLALFAVGEARAAISIATSSGAPLLAEVGEPASFSFSAIGGTPPYTWGVSPAALPQGFAFDAAGGVLTGNASEPGATRLVVTVTDTLGASAAKNFLLVADQGNEAQEAFRHQVSLGRSGNERLLGVSTTPAGTLLVAGYVAGVRDRTPVFGEVDASGTLLWSYKGAAGYDAAGVAIGSDAAGNRYALSSPGTHEHYGSVTLLKFDPAGTLLWSYMLPDEGRPQLDEHLAVQASGRSFVVRHIKYSYGVVVETTAVSPAGVPEWADRLSGDFAVGSVRIDPADNVVVVGSLTSATGGPTQTVPWVRTLSQDGVLTGWRSYVPSTAAAPFEVSGEDIAFGPAGEAFLYLAVQNDAAAVERSGALLKLDAAGEVLWEQTGISAAAAIDKSAKVAIDAAGLVYVASTIDDARDGGMAQVAVLSFEQGDGTYLGMRLFGDAGLSESVAAAVPDGVNGFFAAGSVSNAAGASLGMVARYFTPMPTAAPTFSPEGGTFGAAQQVVLGCATPGCVVAYTTDGSAPSEAGPQADPGTAILISGAATLRAFAFVPGSPDYAPSAETAATYAFVAAAPALSPVGGYFSAPQAVTITSPTEGVRISYTTDGSTPTATNGTSLQNGGAVTVSGPLTLRAAAVRDGWQDSAVTAVTYSFRASAPVFTPAPGVYRPNQTVRILSPTPAAQVIYTTDGSRPSATNGTKAANGVTVVLTQSVTLKAIACVAGWEDSVLASGAYTITTIPAATPTLTPAMGTFSAPQQVTILSASPGATIVYTTDGTTPTQGNGIEIANGSAVTIDRSMTLKAMAFSPNLLPSAVANGTYTFKAAPLVLTPGTTITSTPLTVRFTTDTAGALIRYTTDGTTPTPTVGTSVANGGTVTLNATTTIKAIAYRDGWTSATVVTGTYTFKVLPLVLTPAATSASTPLDVTISSPTADAQIRYTIDGTTPSATAGIEIANGGTVTIDRTRTIRAIAYKAGWSPATVVTATYTLKVAPLVITPGTTTGSTPLAVTLTTETADAQIRYTTDGSTPSATAGIELANGGTVNVDRTMTVKAVAYKAGWSPTMLASATYTMKVAPVVLTPGNTASMTPLAVTVSSATADAQIRYTIDGTTPSATAGIEIANGGTVAIDRTTTLRAIAYKPGWTSTLVTLGTYTLKVAPVVMTPATTSTDPVAVTISSATADASIRYTTDGTMPSATAGTELANGGTVTVDRTTTVKAIAYKAGWTPTLVVSTTYTLKVAPVVLTPGTTTTTTPPVVTISSATADAQIRYTIDGTTPSTTAGIAIANGGTVTLDKTTTVKAIAYKPGWSPTTVVVATYTLKVAPVVLTPGNTASTAALEVKVATETEGAQIRYTTDGTMPSAIAGIEIANGGTVMVDRSMTLRAIAYKTGWSPTLVATGTYTLTVAPVVVTPATTSTTPLTVTVSSATAGAQIRYTIDGTTPSSSVGFEIANGGTLTIDRTTTLKAIGYKAGWSSTAVATATYTLKVSPLVLTPGTTTGFAPVAVTIATDTADALIRYTVDGTTPSATVGLQVANGGTVTVDRTTTLKAIAYKTGWSPTLVATATYTLKVSPMTFSPLPGTFLTSRDVTVSTETEGAWIRYTTDGSTPSATVGTLLANGGTVTVSQTTAFKFIAFRDGWTPTLVASATYTLEVSPLVLTPGTTSATTPLEVTLSSATPDAQIRYTLDGTTPSATAGALVANGGTVTIDRSATLKAIAYKTGWKPSAVATGTYTLKVSPTLFTPAPGTYKEAQTVTISTPTAGASIRYTTDGTLPSATVGTALANGGTVQIDQSTTLKAIAYMDGWTAAAVATATYTLEVGAVTATPGTTSTTDPVTVTLSSTTPDALIRYTTDGTTPSATAGIELANGGTVTIDRTTTLKAIAYKAGWKPSAVTTATYTLKVAPLVFGPVQGTYFAPRAVTLSTPTAGAVIRYTIDGTLPSATVGTELANGGTVWVDQNTVIKAIALKDGWVATSVATGTYTLEVGALAVTPGASTGSEPLAVTLTSATPDALIRYTTDGTTPSATVGTELANGGTVAIDRTTTLKAIAYKAGWKTSAQATVVYTLKVAAPVLSLPGGIYTGAQSVVVTTATAGAEIRYTLDNTIPTRTTGILIASGDTVTVSASGSLRAVAFKADGSWGDSSLTYATYTIR